MFIASLLPRTVHPVVLALGMAAALPSLASATEIKLPPETAALIASPLPGYASAQTLCGTCHSAEYIRYQPGNLSRAFWKANVLKMQKTFGAPIPDTATDPLVDYLVKTYGAERPPPPATRK